MPTTTYVRDHLADAADHAVNIEKQADCLRGVLDVLTARVESVATVAELTTLIEASGVIARELLTRIDNSASLAGEALKAHSAAQ